MENDQRLTPLPITKDLQPVNIEYPGTYSSSYDNALDSRRSIRQYFNIVYKRLPIILAITILTTAAAAFYSFRQPSIYQAQTAMIIEPRKVPQTQKDAININFGDNQQYYNTQLELLKNPDLMKRVVISLGLHRDANLFGEQNRGMFAGIRSLFSGGEKTESTDNSLPIVSDTSPDTAKNGQIQLTPEENTRAELYSIILVSGLRVEPLMNTNIVNISLQSSNPSVAAKAADRVAELFIKEDADRETSGAQKAYEDLGASIEELKGTIAQQENDLIAEMKSGNLPLVEGGNGLRADNLKTLQAQRNDAQLEVERLQTMYNAAVEASKNGDILSIVPDTSKAIQSARTLNETRKLDLEKRLDDLDRRIDEKQQKRQELLVKYTTEEPRVKQVDAEIVELRTQKERIAKEGLQKITIEGTRLEKNAEKELLVSLESQLGASRQRLFRLIAAFDAAAARANVEGQVETKLTTLRDGLKNNRDLLNTYTQRQKEQELALSSGRTILPSKIKR